MSETKERVFPYNKAALLVLLASAVIRVIYLLQLHGSDLWALLSLDARFYTELAHRIASGGGLPGGVITYNPLYPFFLAPIFRLFGDTLIAVRVVQYMLGLSLLWLVYRAGRLLSPKEGGGLTGLVAMVLAALYAQFLLFEGAILATALITFISTAAIAAALSIEGIIGRGEGLPIFGRRIPLWVRTAGLGALLGAGALGRPNFFLPLIVIFPVWFLVRYRRWRCAAACLIGSLLLLAPPLVHNATESGQFVPISAHGGINLYIGNGPTADGTFNTPEGVRPHMEGIVQDSRIIAERRTGREMSHAEASGYWMGETIDVIKADPSRWLKLLGRKLRLMWNGSEISDVVDIRFYRESCPVLGLLLVPFSMISALSLVGLFLVWRFSERRAAVLLFAGSGVISILPFFVNTRYRMPLIPVLILSAAYFISWAVRSASSGRSKGFVLAIAAVAILFSQTARPMVSINPSAGYTFLGNFHMEHKQEKKAEEAFREAYRLDPDRVETLINYARILKLRDGMERSRELYSRAFERRPDFPMLAVEYGSLLDSVGEREMAKETFRYAVSIGRRRDSVVACKLLSRIALSEGSVDEAVYWIRKALEILPGDKDLLEMLQWIERQS